MIVVAPSPRKKCGYPEKRREVRPRAKTKKKKNEMTKTTVREV